MSDKPAGNHDNPPEPRARAWRVATDSERARGPSRVSTLPAPAPIEGVVVPRLRRARVRGAVVDIVTADPSKDPRREES